MPKQDALTDLAITLKPGTDAQAAAARLRQAGLQSVEVLDAIGVVTGRADAATAKRLRGLPGVADVASTPSADVGPPDAPIS